MIGELLSNVRALVALLLLGLSVPALGLAYARTWRLGASEPGARRAVLGATAVAAVLRWLVAPKQLVTMYIGYLLTEQAIELSAASHYGMGSLALYHALFSVFPRDHLVVLWANAVVGVATLPLAAAFAGRLLGHPRVGAAFALLVACTPLFIKNDASDANHVPVLWWLFGGLVLWDEFLETGARPALVAATALLALAGNGRPEMPLLVPALLGLVTLALRPPRARLAQPAVFVAAGAAALLVAPHALHVLSATAALEERDSLPGTGAGGLVRAVTSLVSQDTVLTPSLFPVTLVALALLGLAEPLLGDAPRGALRARLAIAGAAVLTLGVYGLDLCRANMARVHVPGALLVTMLAAAGAAFAWRRVPGVGARAALVLAVALAALPTARTLWAPTNEQAEEDVLRAALARLPAEPYTLVRMDRADRDRASPGSDFTHHHFPDYLVRPPGGPGRVSSIHDWLAQPDFSRPAFFYLGTRCYAEFRPADAPRPHGDALQPACARLLREAKLEPVLEVNVPNRGDVWLEYYGDAPSLKLGLYRLAPR